MLTASNLHQWSAKRNLLVPNKDSGLGEKDAKFPLYTRYNRLHRRTEKLEARFKRRTSKGLTTSTSKTYTGKDTKDDREATTFLQNVILYAQSIGASYLPS